MTFVLLNLPAVGTCKTGWVVATTKGSHLQNTPQYFCVLLFEKYISDESCHQQFEQLQLTDSVAKGSSNFWQCSRFIQAIGTNLPGQDGMGAGRAARERRWWCRGIRQK